MLHAHDLSKRYGEATVFAGVNLEVPAGEFLAITGDSGVGKSTLLNILAALDTHSTGEVWVQGVNLATLDETGLAHFRRRHLGFVFQAFHVLPHLNVAQNVSLPLLLLQEGSSAERQARMRQALELVGLQGLGERLPRELSGGQLQRVAMARALIHRPALILADEPTGNLDPQTAERVMRSLTDRIREQGTSCIMVTHSPAAAACADRVLHLTAQGLQART